MKSVITLTLSFAIFASANEGELTTTVLDAKIIELGADGFRTRRSAQKYIVTNLRALQKRFLKTLDQTKNKPSAEFKKLNDKLKACIKKIEKSAANADDPEIKMRTKKIMNKMYPSIVYEQNIKVQKLLLGTFHDITVKDDLVSVHTHATKNTRIVEIGDIRIIQFGMNAKKDSDDFSFKVPINYPAGGSQSSDSSGYKYYATEEFTTVRIKAWNNWGFKLVHNDLVIGKKSIQVGKGKRIIIMDANGNYGTPFSFFQENDKK